MRRLDDKLLTCHTSQRRPEVRRLSLYSGMVLLAAVGFACGGILMKYADELRNPNPSMIIFVLFVLGIIVLRAD
jgi:drug/metabolite transporter (DMT)-like permease